MTEFAFILQILPAYVIVDKLHVYITNQKSPSVAKLTPAVIPKRNAFVALHEMRSLETVLIFKPGLQLRSIS